MTITAKLQANPLVNPPSLPNDAPAFDAVKVHHILRAIIWGIEQAEAEIDAIKNNPAMPTFENTIEALEFAGADLDRISSVYSIYSSSISSDRIRKLDKLISPRMSQHGSNIGLDDVLFARVKAVYDARATLNLDPQQTMLLEKSYKGFVRSGALLSPQDKQTLRDLTQRKSALRTDFSQNNVNATKAYKKIIDNEADLEGIPDRVKKQYKEAADKAGLVGKWLIGLAPHPTDILTRAKNRALREEIHRALWDAGCIAPYDNRPVILETVALRDQTAKLLGYTSHADFTLSERMAGSPQAVEDFLEKNLKAYKPAAEAFLKELTDFAKATDGLTDLKPWDTGYYAQALEEKTFNFDSEELTPYFQLDAVLQGLQQHAEKLFNIEMKSVDGKYPVYHPDVKVYEITDKKDGKLLSLFYTDYFARPGAKRPGAWMNAMRNHSFHNGTYVVPIITNTCNFAGPTADTPALLSLGEVTTVFHEFGHALHGILAEGKYASLNGTNVKWDFVELPSMLQENWAMEKEVLNGFAKHWQTGAVLPDDLFNKAKAAATFGAGSIGLRQTLLGLLDMKWHNSDPATLTSVEAVEDEIFAKASVLKRETGSQSSTFGHIFSGGYSSGYYSYKWSEVLEADVFGAFKKNGLYDRATADRLRATIYSKGGTVPPMDLFKAMMGRAPDQNALFIREGITVPANNNATPVAPPVQKVVARPPSP